MPVKIKISGTILLLFILYISATTHAAGEVGTVTAPLITALPRPDTKQGMPLNLVIKNRRSHRRFSDTELSLSDLSQLLWSAQGITHFLGFRTAPSAGARYPLEIYVVAGNVAKLNPGIYHYQPGSHQLERIATGDQRSALSRAAGKQGSIARAAATLVISAVPGRSEKKYGSRAIRYVQIEAGSAAQNIYLQATSLQLNTVFVGSFSDNDVKQLLQLPADHIALGLMPIGHQP